MITATTEKDTTITLSLTMDKAAARELLCMVQNPIQEDESAEAANVRMVIFNAINNAL